MKKLANAVLFQLAWLATVAGAARGWWWAGPLAVGAFGAWQVRTSERAHVDLELVAIAVAIGFVADSSLVRTGLLEFAAPWPALPWAPVWILALWANLALTLNHSLAFVQRRPALAGAFGAVSAPLAYWAAARGWGAVRFAEPATLALVALAVGWGLTMPALALLARRLNARGDALALRDSRS